ncbi:MAG TPA: DUF362 domain-containing protein [Spirochaetia bacterium]|nr:DUF362 domain-containing protein [Spirochaetia bacterium]
MSSRNSQYRVRAVRCEHTANDEEVYTALKRATDPLERSWQRLESARRIGIKFNQDWNPDRIIMRHGHRQQLVSDPVVRATIRLLRERTTAEVFVVDVGVEGGAAADRRNYTSIAPVLEELSVPYIDGRTDPVAWAKVPGGGLMFERYPVPSSSLEADAFVSVQKAKNHKFMGVTLSLKNLFGLASVDPNGRPRAYYHHFVRLPYVLADLGRIYDPALNILDAMVCQAGEEWGPGEHPQDSNALIAGDHTVATDACVTALMGHRPESDWPEPPFHRDRNAVLVAAESGYGTVNLNEIDFDSEIDAPMGEFFGLATDPAETVRAWLRTTCEQGVFYEQNRERLVAEHAGNYILLQMGEVRWSDPSGRIRISRREIAGDHPEQGMWLKFVDPEETEGEHFEIYSNALARLA